MKVIKEIPNAKYPFLRYQVGRNEKRIEQLPIWDGNKVIGHRASLSLVPTFHLLGWGSTLKKAEQMAFEAEMCGQKGSAI